MTYPNGITLDIDFTQSTLGGMTFARASGATDGLFTDAAGSSYNTFANDVPRYSATWGLLSEPQARTNLLLNSTAPATQTVSLTTGTSAAHCLWVIGTGSAAITAGTGTATGLGTATAGNPVFFTVTANGTFTVTVTGTLNRFQLEKGGNPTSFIVTAGATATRAAETCTLAIGGWYIAGDGTLLCDSSWVSTNLITNTGIVALDDGTLNNRITNSQNTQPQLLMSAAGVSQVNAAIASITIAANTNYRIAQRWSAAAGTERGCANGVLGTAQTGKTIPTITQLNIVLGATANLGATIRIRRIQYWPFAMTDADLQAATSVPPVASISSLGRGVARGLIARPTVTASLGARGRGVARGRTAALGPFTFSIAALGRSVAWGRARVYGIRPPPGTITRRPATPARRIDTGAVGFDTLLLDRTTWDLVVDAYGNIATAAAPYAIAQDVASAIRLFAGELWYDTTKGIPYFEEVLGHAPPLPLLKQLIEQAAMSVPRVASARAFVTSAQGRTITGQVQVTTDDGTTLTVSETFLGNAPA